jgi:hypothetical protein
MRGYSGVKLVRSNPTSTSPGPCTSSPTAASRRRTALFYGADLLRVLRQYYAATRGKDGSKTRGPFGPLVRTAVGIGQGEARKP